MTRRLAPLLLLLALAAPAPGAATGDTVVYAHRGGADLGPENTLALFAATHAAYDGIWLELDVQLASDGELVVIHDATLDRTTDCVGPVVAKTSVELQSCNAADLRPSWGFQPVPTFRAVLNAGKTGSWRLLAEIKNIPTEPNFDPTGSAAAAELLSLLFETEFPAANIVVQSFFPTSLDYIELSAGATVHTALLTTSRLHDALPPGAGFYATENGIYATARGYEITAPDHTSPDLSEETVAAIQALGRGVVVWTVDAPSDIATALGWGVDGIISDRPDLVYAALA